MEPEKLKVTELREELAARGLSTKGLKAELVARLQEFLVSESSTDVKPASEVAAQTEPSETTQSSSPKKSRASPRKNKTLVEAEAQQVELTEVEAKVDTAQELTSGEPTVKRARTEEVQSSPEEASLQSTDQNLADAASLQETEKAIPSENPPSTVIHITKLHRPFHEKQLKEFIGETFSDFWMNSIKSECLVRFDSVEQAVACRNRIAGKVFPIESNHTLKVDFSSEADFANIQAPEVDASIKESENSLTTFFKKTKIEPAIYYLPKEQ